uniref:Uncharacterized protein n=1 Tax=Octopus bimaculoides TaxID=37653 RepID=A0A0L8H4Z3_OCTBM
MGEREKIAGTTAATPGVEATVVVPARSSGTNTRYRSLSVTSRRLWRMGKRQLARPPRRRRRDTRSAA